MKKKFLSLLTLVIAIIVAVALVACEGYGKEDGNEEKPAERTFTHTIKNGTFYSASSTSNASSGNKTLLLDSVANWTQSSGSTTSSKVGDNGVLSAAIDMSDEAVYNGLAKEFFNVSEDLDANELDRQFVMPYPGIDPMTPIVNVVDKAGKTVTEADGTVKTEREDANVFALANVKQEGSIYVQSSSTTLEANSKYLLQFSVCSMVDADEGDTTKGAWFILSGDMEYTVKCINTNGKWETYYLFIETNKYSSMTITANLWLGYGPGPATGTTTPDDKGIYSTRGIAFFDNVICEKIEANNLKGAITDSESAVKSYGSYEYNAEAATSDDFAAFKSALVSKKDGAGNKYVTAKSAYYLTNADMELRSKPTSYSTSSYRKYFYSFRENFGSSNLSKYSVKSSTGSTPDSRYYGSVDASKLYTVITDSTTDKEKYKDEYSPLISTNYSFDAMGYDNWVDNVMNDPNHNLAGAEESYVLMMYNDKLQANKLVTTETVKIDPDVFYEISVWAYVWAKEYTDSDDKVHYYPQFSKTEPIHPTEKGGTFSAAQKQLYTLITDNLEKEGSVFKGYTEALTEEEIALADAYNEAIIALGTYSFSGLDSETMKTNEAKWLRGLLGLGDTDDVSNITEKFYFAYLYENYDEYKTVENFPDQDVLKKLYLYERRNNIDAYKPLEASIKTYETEHNDWVKEKKDYENQYDKWEAKNSIPAATVKLTGAGDGLEKQTDVLNKWQKISFYVRGNQLSQRQLTVELCFGTGSDESTFMLGGVFFDNIEINAFAGEDKIPAALDGVSWKRLSQINGVDSIAFGGLYGNAEYSETVGTAIARDNWQVKVGEGTAASDELEVSARVIDAEVGTIDIAEKTQYLYALEYSHNKATASTLTYTGDNGVKILPNRFYRFAFLVKTVDIDESLGINITLVYGKNPDDMKEAKDSSVTKYTNNKDEWAEMVYYICGDLEETYYVGISAAMGSGTRFVTTSYVSGKAYFAAFNVIEIDYDEYNSAATGDKIISNVSLYNISAELDNASISVNNGYYSKIDYSSTDKEEFDENGKLTGVGATNSWSLESSKNNNYDAPKDLKLKVSANEMENSTLSWKGSEGVTSNANGEIVTGLPTHYEIWMKYTDDEGNAKEKLYDAIAISGENTEYTYELDNAEWADKRYTYFAVKAVGEDGISNLTSYTANTLGKDNGDEPEPKSDCAFEEAKVRMGTVLSKGLFDVDQADGVHYVSPYKTVMKITANYDGVYGIHSSSVSSGFSADKFYKVSVWVKTDVGTYASITIGGTSGALQASTDDSQLGFVMITTNGKWEEFSFFIKTGNFTPKLYVRYNIGNPYAKSSSGKIGTGDKTKFYDIKEFSRGTAYFDAVRIVEIKEDEYKNAKDLDEAYNGTGYASALHEILYTDIKYYIYCMEYVMDSFDASTEANSSASSDNNYTGNTPSNYNRNFDSDLTNDKTQANYGVYSYENSATDESMKIAIQQLYKYKKTSGDEDVFVFNDILTKELFNGAFDPTDWEINEWDSFMKEFLSVDRKNDAGNVVYDGGSNVLVMSNKVASGYAQNYTLDSTYNYKVNAGDYVKITFSARTLIARVIPKEVTDSQGTTTKEYSYDVDNAFGEFRLNPSTSGDDTVNVKISSYVYGKSAYDDVTYTVYLYNPTDSTNTVNWSFYLGDEKDDDDKTETYLDWYIVGMMAIDLVSAEKVTKEAYDAAVNAANASGDKSTVYTYKYPEDKKKPDDDNKDDEGEDDKKEESGWDRLFNNQYFWLYISSFVIALVILVTVIVLLVRRWKKKHPKEVQIENISNTEKEIKVMPAAPQIKEDASETDEWNEEQPKPVTVQRKVNKKSRRDRKKH